MITQRNNYLDIVKGIAIILVVLGHCIQYGSGHNYLASELYFENPVFKFIYSFHMPLFMLISGYLFSGSVKHKEWNEVLLGKFRSLIVPLIAWSIVSLILNGITNDGTVEIRTFLSVFLYSNWFLWALWWSSLIIICTKRFFNNSLIIYIFIFLVSFVIPDSLNLHLYKFMFPYFWLGFYLGSEDYTKLVSERFLNSPQLFRYSCYLSVWVVFVVLLIFCNYDFYIYTSKFTLIGKNIALQLYNNLYRFLIGAVGSMAMLSLIYYITIIMPVGLKDILAYIGKNTLGIYIISSILNTTVLMKFTSVLPNINILFVLIETIGILIISLIINAILKKAKLIRMLFLGGR